MNSKTELYKNIIVPIVKKHAPRAKIILYGSRARGDYDEGAGIDIALDEGETIHVFRFAAILDDLEESDLPIVFDIVDFRRVPEYMQQEILKDGVVWQEKSSSCYCNLLLTS